MLNQPLTLLVFILLCGFSQYVKAQPHSDTLYPYSPSDGGFGPVLAYRGFNSHILEAGLTYANGGHGIVGYELTFMSNLKREDELLHGYSFSRYVGFAFFEAAMAGTLFTNYKESHFYLKPSIGLGFGGIATVNYGYNFTLGASPIHEQISRHEIRVVIRYPIGLL